MSRVIDGTGWEPDVARRTGRDGWLALRFSRADDRTVLTRCRYTLPLQVLSPVALDDRAAVVSILNPSGGVLGGDRLRIEVHADAGAHACLTTPSATKIYRTSGEPAGQEVRLTLARDAVVEWIPDHTIPFPGSAFRQQIDVDVAAGATLVLVDTFAAGRVARGEAWRFALLDSALSIRDEHGWLLRDRFWLVRPEAIVWDGLGFSEGCAYFGSIAVVADTGIEGFIEAVRDSATDSRATLAAARLPRRGVIVRVLASTAPALTEAVEQVWAAARHHTVGAPALALRKP